MRRLAPLLALAAGACIPSPPHVTPAPPPAPVESAPEKPSETKDWRDQPYTPGAWTYRDGVARYGVAGAPPVLTLACDRQARTVSLAIAGRVATLTLRTSYGVRAWPARAIDGRSVVSLAAADPALDQLAFSRGRFSILAPGNADLELPAWAEPARVIEDCRS